MNLKKGTLDYDVALSFAGEDRAIAQAIAERLRARKIRVFYDKFEESQLWGKNLYDHLAEVYSKRAAFCLMILSKNYADKAWTNHERRHAQARAFNENNEYILPLKLDDTQIPGIEPTLGYIDLRNSNLDKVVDLLESKLSIRSDKDAVREESALVLDTAILSLNLSTAALGFISARPDGWPCGLFLEVLREEIEAARTMRLDLQYGFATGKARYFEVAEFFKWIGAQFGLIGRQVVALERLANEGLQAALVPKGHEGDPVSICIIARKMGALYKWAAEWGIEFRSASVGDDFTHLLDLCSGVSLILMDGIEELYDQLRACFDHWCALDEEEKAAYKAKVEIDLPSPDTREIVSEISRLQCLYSM